jgi:hypothetical protein
MQTPLDVELVRLPGSHCGCEPGAHGGVRGHVDSGGTVDRRTAVGPKELELRNVRSIAPWHSAPTPRVRQDGAPSSVSPRRRRPRGRPCPRSAPAHLQGGRPHAAPGQGARCARVATDWPASPAPAVAHRDGLESGSSDLQQHHRSILRTPVRDLVRVGALSPDAPRCPLLRPGGLRQVLVDQVPGGGLSSAADACPGPRWRILAACSGRPTGTGA